VLALQRMGVLIVPELLYLDYNCFQREFDDWGQARIRMEAAACEKVFQDAEAGAVDLVWSFMHADENDLCPFVDRKLEILRLSEICRVRLDEDDGVRTLARRLETAGLSGKDAVHLAVASSAKAAAFLTCDDQLIRKANRLRDRLPLEIAVMNPVEYVLKMRP
jgi:hypothetical protein